jgi:uncharacterized protein YkwD
MEASPTPYRLRRPTQPRKGLVLRALTLSPARTLASVLFPLLALAMTGIIPMSSADAATTSAASAAVYEEQAVRTTNNQRTRRDMRALRTDSCLTRYANQQATRMANQRRLFHQDLSPILRRCDMTGVGENVAYGYPSGRSVVNEGWMKSPGHRHNILTRKFRVVAVAAAQDDIGNWYTAQVLGRR